MYACALSLTMYRCARRLNEMNKSMHVVTDDDDDGQNDILLTDEKVAYDDARKNTRNTKAKFTWRDY